MGVAEDSGLLFNRIAEEYDHARPDYPPELVDLACSIGGLGAGSKVVEVGCGTGKLTVALAERGLAVEAVDPGAELVEVARRKVGGATVRFHVARFEDVELPESSFAAVFSATAFHWIEPAVGWAKAARLLRPAGVLALLAHVGGASSELDAAMLAAWREVLPEAAEWVWRDQETLWKGAEARRGNVAELWAWLANRPIGRPEAAELFGEATVSRFSVELPRSAEQWLALIRTQSAYLRLDAERRERLENRIVPILEKGFADSSTSSTALVTAHRR